MTDFMPDSPSFRQASRTPLLLYSDSILGGPRCGQRGWLLALQFDRSGLHEPHFFAGFAVGC